MGTLVSATRRTAGVYGTVQQHQGPDYVAHHALAEAYRSVAMSTGLQHVETLCSLTVPWQSANTFIVTCKNC